MTRGETGTSDLADRLGSVKMSESGRRRTVMLTRQSEDLIDLLRTVFSRGRRVLARTRRWLVQALGEPVPMRSRREAHVRVLRGSNRSGRS
jgi:hypothetical protein